MSESKDDFWAVIRAQLTELESAQSADDVIRILSLERNPYGYGAEISSADGFFAGSGGDDTVAEALETAGWTTVWTRAAYYYAMRAPDGSLITYIEGDIYKGDRLAGGA
jgi:hypothetical protein